jgi:hypothetical protein
MRFAGGTEFPPHRNNEVGQASAVPRRFVERLDAELEGDHGVGTKTPFNRLERADLQAEPN